MHLLDQQEPDQIIEEYIEKRFDQGKQLLSNFMSSQLCYSEH